MNVPGCKERIAAATAAGVVGAFFVAKLPAALPALERELALSLVGASVVVSAFNTLAVLAAPVFGILADRVGAFVSVLAGLALLGAGALVALAGNEAALIASRVIEGSGFLAVVVAAPALIAAAAPSTSRRLALGLWTRLGAAPCSPLASGKR